MSAEAFIEQLDRKFGFYQPTEHSVSKADQLGWLSNGQTSAANVTSYFLNESQLKFNVDSISRVYFTIFGRMPDTDGMRHWLSVVQEAQRQGEIPKHKAHYWDTGLETQRLLIKTFITSQEYDDRYGDALTGSEFSNLLYETALGRAADSYGKRNYASHTDLILSVSSSYEMTNALSHTLQTIASYYGLLDRLPSDEELSAAPDSQIALINQLYASSEYQGVAPPIVITHSLETTLSEDHGQLRITISRTGDVSQSSSLEIKTKDISAIAGEDYVALQQTVTFNANETSKEILIDITDDNVTELAETFGIEFSNIQNGVLAETSVEIQISKNDEQTAVALATLVKSSGVTISGEQTSRSGQSVSDAGDVNGDGYSDILIGGSENSYLIFGQKDGWNETLNLSNLNGSDGVKFTNVGPIARSAGDVNGDGFADILIGNPNKFDYADKVYKRGESYLIFGHGDSWSAELDSSALDGTNGVLIQGINEYDEAGSAVSTVGDLNNDGYDDMVVAAPRQGDNDAGQAYLLFGHSGDWQNIKLADLSAVDGISISRNNSKMLGIAVANAGDVNGDGIADMLISEAAEAVDGNYSNPIHSYLIFGRQGTWDKPLDLDSLSGSDGVRIDLPAGPNAAPVRSAGDVNGDGIGDIIIGDPSNDSAYLIFGKNSAWESTLDVTTLDGTDGVRFNGENTKNLPVLTALTGVSVSGIGDINKDGFGDLIIGNREQYFVIWGRSEGWQKEYDLFKLDESDGRWIVQDSSSYDRFGYSASGAGDVNGDGFSDFLMSDPWDGDGGESYLIFGSGQLFG